LSGKLRLSVQADVDRRSAKTGERGTERDPLLGGMAVCGGEKPARAN